MAHDDPFAGKTVHADWAFYLDTSGTYTPTLTATTTDPNLGDTGTATGAWHRNGHLITGWAIFEFGGTGVDAGSGTYLISLPFDADGSILETSSGNATGFGSPIGVATSRDSSTTSNSSTGIVVLEGAGACWVQETDSAGRFGSANPFIWADGDRLLVNFAYLADSAGLPS